MNGPGGMKFFSLLSDKLANDTKLAIGKKKHMAMTRKGSSS